MTVGLARRLVWEGIVGPDDVNAALYTHVTERTSFLAALVRSRPELAARLEAELGTSRAGISSVVVQEASLAALLPPGLAEALLVVPVGRDPQTGAVRVVAAEPADTHVQAELAYHFGAPVEVSGAPLRSIIAALSLRGAAPEVHLTPAFGTSMPEAPASVVPPTPGGAPSSPRASVVPSSPAPIPIENPRPKASPESPVGRPSDRPIPLVRVSSEPAPPPATVKGVAPQAMGTGRASPQVVVQRRNPAPVAPEPVIELTRAKSVAPRDEGRADSSPPMTVPGTGPLLATTLVGPVPAAVGAAEGQVVTTMPAPGYDTSSAPATDEEAAARALDELGLASSAEEVVSALIRGLGAVASRVLVLAVRGKVFEGRDASDGPSREAVRSLVVSGERPSVLLTAMQTGSYLGPVPRTLVHAELARILDDASDEIAVGVVSVSGRAALVYVAAGLQTAYLATRRGDQLAGAAGRALERIVRQRKK
jgi:hypothetical protein